MTWAVLFLWPHLLKFPPTANPNHLINNNKPTSAAVGQNTSAYAAPVAPPTYLPVQTQHDSPLGRHIPKEIVNQIYEYALSNDNNITVIPQPTGVYRDPHGNLRYTYITSRCPLLRTCKASRNIYSPMLEAKVLDFNFQSLQVVVQDFDFSPFITGFRDGLTYNNQAQLIQMQFPVKLVWTEAFLQNPFLYQPATQNLGQWLHYCRDEEPILSDQDMRRPRGFNFIYIFPSMPAKYVHPMQNFLTHEAIKRWRNAGPELRAINRAFQLVLSSGEIYEEGPDVKLHGHWDRGEWVVEVDDGTPVTYAVEMDVDGNGGEETMHEGGIGDRMRARRMAGKRRRLE